MKCLKAIKVSKYSNVGDIVRVSDEDAMLKVDSGYWMFISKTEWKKETRKPKESVQNIKESDEKLKKNQKKRVNDKKQKIF